MAVQTDQLNMPHSVTAEQEVLGAILFEPETITQVIDVLDEDSFYRGPHRNIYRAMLALFKASEPIDIVTVSEWLNDDGSLESSGGRPYLMDLAMNVATSEAIRYHANIVKDYAVRRELMYYAESVLVDAQHKSSIDVMEAAQTQLMDIAIKADHTAEPSTKEVSQKALEELIAQIQSNTDITGIPTGYPDLDASIKGLNETNFIILAARPGMGKTGLALNIAANVAIRQGLNVLYYTLEMTEKQMMQRLLISEAETRHDITRLIQAEETIPPNLKFIRKPALSIPQLRASIVRNTLEMGRPSLVVIDYLQLMFSTRRTLFEQVSEISTDLKNLALEFKLPILALSQLSREVEKRHDKKPQLSDLRQSGSLEQDADSVLFIYRDEYYNKQTDKPGMADIIIAKNRHGSVGEIPLVFRAPIVKFYSAAPCSNASGF